MITEDSLANDRQQGFAFCEYADPATTDIAVEGLNDMELGNQHLKVARASIGAAQVGNPNGAMSVGAMSLLAGTTSGDLDQGRVLQLLNMVTPEELMDSEEYAEICQDVKEECEKYGAVEEMKVPRPVVGDRQNPGIGKIYVKYDGPESAQKALKVLAGRKFADRTVVVTFFGEVCTLSKTRLMIITNASCRSTSTSMHGEKRRLGSAISPSLSVMYNIKSSSIGGIKQGDQERAHLASAIIPRNYLPTVKA